MVPEGLGIVLDDSYLLKLINIIRMTLNYPKNIHKPQKLPTQFETPHIIFK